MSKHYLFLPNKTTQRSERTTTDSALYAPHHNLTSRPSLAFHLTSPVILLWLSHPDTLGLLLYQIILKAHEAPRLPAIGLCCCRAACQVGTELRRPVPAAREQHPKMGETSPCDERPLVQHRGGLVQGYLVLTAEEIKAETR